jgi:L-histidine Nalpha-methyltransferase
MSLDRHALWEEIREGLSRTPPSLPPKLFYDEHGAELFEEITRLPEYYPTRTELEILGLHLPEMAALVGPRARVVEFGSGSGRKTRLLLEALDAPAAYIPVDIAAAQLTAVAARMDRDFPDLQVLPLAADYTHPFHLPEAEPGAGRPLLFFPGSTVGNFEPGDAVEFLRQAGESLGPDAALLIGVDLVKPREILEPAYNDAAGVTAEFNRNALVHLNRLLGTDFSPLAFAHRAPWNAEASRIEMHLVALEPCIVNLPSPGGHPAARFEFREGDFLVTEHSYKYEMEDFEALAERAGWRPVGTWTDPREFFAVQLLLRT